MIASKMLVYISGLVILLGVLALRHLYKKLWFFTSTSKDHLFDLDLLKHRPSGDIDIELDQSKRDKVLKNAFSIDKVPKSLDAIVIGSGVGGLTPAVLLSKAGKKVLVLEQHDQAGGCCHVFAEKGFEFDIGIHYVGNMNEGSWSRLLADQLTGGKLQWAPLDNVYDVLAIGENYQHRYEYPLGHENHIKYLISKFPDEEKAIRKFFQYMKEAVWCTGVMALLKLLPKPLVKCLLALNIIQCFFPSSKYLTTTVNEILDKLTDNVDLKSALTYNFGSYATPPDEGSFAMHSLLQINYIRANHYPIGGASEIPYNMIPIIEAAGGRVLVRVRVKEIIVSDGCAVGVKVTKGKHEYKIMAPLIISDAGLMNTVHKLLPDHVTKKYQMDSLTKLVKPAPGFLMVFIGLNGTKEELGLKSQNIWCSVDDIEKLTYKFRALTAEKPTFDELPGLFIGFPSAKDPTFNLRYPGKSTCSVLTFGKYEWFEEWKNEKVMHRGDDYNSLKMEIGRWIWKSVCILYPHLEDKLEYLEVGTPLSFQYYLESYGGTGYGLDHTVYRFDPYVQTELRPETPVSGLYLTGQDLFSDGFSGAMFGGAFCASAILQYNVMLELMELRNIWKKLN